MRTVVVIPVYNEQAYIQQCLDCLSRQTVLPDEVLVVNNNCNDNTLAIARTYAFVRIVNEGQQGICAATKTGFDESAQTADIILRCDADSRPPRQWVQKIEEAFNDEDTIGITGPGTFYELHGVKKRLAETLYMKAYFLTVGLALRQKPLFGSNCAIRSSAWKNVSKEVHLHRQDIHDDIDISFHLAKQGRLVYLPNVKMPISPRPLTSLGSLLRRFPMGMRSIVIHWPEQAPWNLYKARRN